MKCLTIITVTYNAEKSIEKTLRSVISQTVFADQVEYIVIDGGSKDSTLAIVNRYADHITHIVSEPDHGIYDAMNKGVALATAPWVVFVNADDTFFSPDTIELLNLEQQQPDHILYGDHLTVYPDGREELTKGTPFWEHPELIMGLGICHQSIYCPTEWMRLHPFQWQIYNYCADFEAMYYWRRQGKNFTYVGRPLSRFAWGDGFSSTPKARMKVLEQNARITGRYYSLKHLKMIIRICLGL